MRHRDIPALFISALLVLSLTATSSDYAPEDHYRERGPIDSPRGGHINISGYAFRDINRSGRYDLGDQAMRGLVFLVVDTNGRRHRSTSNAAGFANFRMSAEQSDAVFREPGEYTLVAVPPPGFSVSTDNAVQQIEVHSMPGSIADLYVEPFPEPVGIVADRVLQGVAEPSTQILYKGESDRAEYRIPLAADGRFRAQIEPGAATLRHENSDNEVLLERVVTVDHHPVHVSRIREPERQASLSDGRDGLPIETIDFSGLATSEEVVKVPDGFAGLQWNSLNAMHVKFASGPGYRNTNMEGGFIVYGSSGHPGGVYSDEPFDFIGAYLGFGWDDADGEVLTVRGFRDGILLYEDEIALSPYGPVYFDADYLQVDRVHFATQRYWQYVIDNMKVRVDQD